MTTSNTNVTQALQSLEPKVQKYAIFRCVHVSSNFIFPDGSRAVFIGGRYVTDDPEKIAVLDKEIARGSQVFRRGTPEEALGANSDDPMAALRKKFFDEFQADQARIQQQLRDGRDLGESVQGQFKTATTKDIAAVTIGHGAPT